MTLKLSDELEISECAGGLIAIKFDPEDPGDLLYINKDDALQIIKHLTEQFNLNGNEANNAKQTIKQII